jgi:CubicO group peptidase (beta-lactamase class C family)
MSLVSLVDDLSKQTYFAELLASLSATGLKDVIIIHNDSLAADWHAEGIDRVNFIFSCTKSFLSALIGIALDQQLISSIDQPIIEYFPELPQLNSDLRFQRITIRHLLSMTSGIDWPPMDRGKRMYDQMVRSGDWVEFVLRRPLANEPGARFNYTDGGSHLLSAILTRATRTTALAYASHNLFPYLGIHHIKWRDNHGVNLGGTGLHMRTIDMAMLGYLYLNDGKLGQAQVVAKAWVKDSTRSQAEGHPEWFGSYGFHWWVSPQAHNGHADIFYALGSHGQYIFVIPAKKAVAAFRKKPGRKQDVFLPRTILFERVLPCL